MILNNTPTRSIRISDKLWIKAKNKAKRQHTTVSAVIVAALINWLDSD
jgi:hypothetical protein